MAEFDSPLDNQALATRIREQALRMTNRAGSSHIGGSLSIADLLAVLYNGVLRVDPARPDWPDRDRFILSKGHSVAAVYAVLAERGFFPVEWLDKFYLDGSRLAGHITYGVPGVEAATGSLGHGLPIACGMGLAARYDGRRSRVFVLLSDGECDEGSTWEAAMFAPAHSLDNITAIVDYNGLQALGRTRDILDLEPLADKWQAFGWAVRTVDGHDLDQIAEVLRSIPFEPGRPSCIVARTVKGKGVSFMEDKLAWHYKAPDDEQLNLALKELGVL